MFSISCAFLLNVNDKTYKHLNKQSQMQHKIHEQCKATCDN